MKKWVVNAAFNGGNSGDPLLQVETGEVIGVVSSKLAPITPQSMSALNALESNAFGMMYNATMPDGTTKSVSEAQIVGAILNELRNQVQLVIGYAVTTSDIRAFPKDHNIEP